MKHIPITVIFWLLLILPQSALAQNLHKVYMEDGRVLVGEVIDRGNKVEISFTRGKVRGKVWILKKEIIKIEPVEEKAAPDKHLLDAIELLDGRILEGTIIKETPQRVYLEMEKYGSKAVMGFEKKRIKRILYRKDREKMRKERKENPFINPTISPEFAKKILETIELLQSWDLAGVVEAREELLKLGIFAEPFLRKSLKEKEKLFKEMTDFHNSTPFFVESGAFLYGPATEVGAMPLKRCLSLIREILGIGRVKKLVTSEMEEKIRNIYSRLASSSASIRLGVLQEIVLYAPKSIRPILTYFINKEDETPTIKAYCITQLGILGEIKELTKIYEDSDGQLKFVAAMALGDNGSFIGIPTLMDALAFDDLKIRKIAIDKLKEYTGEFQGYFADEPLPKRQQALLRWREWWKQNAAKYVGPSIKILMGGKVSLKDKKEGLFLWKQGREQMEKGLYTLEKDTKSLLLDRAIYNFEKSLRLYPSFVSARFNLAKLLYQEKKDYDKALNHLKSIVTRYRREAGEMGQKLAYYHMGTIYSIQGKWDQAVFRYQRALTLDPHFIDGHIGLGYAYAQKASYSSAKPEAIRELYREALKAYQAALKDMEYADKRIIQARLPQDPKWVIVKNNFAKISYADYTRASKTLKGMVYFEIGNTYLALRKYGLAVSKFKEALKWDPQNLQYKDKLKYWEAAEKPKD